MRFTWQRLTCSPSPSLKHGRLRSPWQVLCKTRTYRTDVPQSSSFWGRAVLVLLSLVRFLLFAAPGIFFALAVLFFETNYFSFFKPLSSSWSSTVLVFDFRVLSFAWTTITVHYLRVPPSAEDTRWPRRGHTPTRFLCERATSKNRAVCSVIKWQNSERWFCVKQSVAWLSRRRAQTNEWKKCLRAPTLSLPRPSRWEKIDIQILSWGTIS